MSLLQSGNAESYRVAMGQLLVLYTQVDRLIMEACAERIASAPDESAKLGLAKQVGDESRHVAIQKKWIEKFKVNQAPVISAVQEAAMLEHFRKLDWIEFLIDMYLCVEALGSDAVENVVPLADPGTQAALQIPLQDELDHIAFGVNRLKQELLDMDASERDAVLERIPQRIEQLNSMFHGLGLDVRILFEGVGASYEALCQSVLQRKAELLQEVSEAVAA